MQASLLVPDMHGPWHPLLKNKSQRTRDQSEGIPVTPHTHTGLPHGEAVFLSYIPLRLRQIPMDLDQTLAATYSVPNWPALRSSNGLLQSCLLVLNIHPVLTSDFVLSLLRPLCSSDSPWALTEERHTCGNACGLDCGCHTPAQVKNLRGQVGENR